jgi:glycosyltransferase involved in cell wall biosynthesis
MRVGLVALSDIDSSFDLANALQGAGLTVILYLSYERTARSVNSPEEPEEAVFQQCLLDHGIKMRLFHYPRMRDPRSLRVIRAMIRAMHADQVDVVHILAGNGELWLAVLAFLLWSARFRSPAGSSPRIPVVSTLIIPEPNQNDLLPAWMELAVNSLAAHSSDMVIVNGEDQIELVRRMYKASTDKILWVPLCARMTALRWANRETLEQPGTVLFFGRVEPHKGLEYLIRAQPLITRKVPDAHIVIAGYGSDLERCRRMIRDTSKFDIYEGYATGEEMAALFQQASLVVLPYISASTSGILGTAFGFAKPVIATSVGCLPEYVEDGVTGYLVPPYDAERLAEGIVDLLVNDKLRLEMGQNARRWVNEHQATVPVLTLEAYQRVIEAHRGLSD